VRADKGSLILEQPLTLDHDADTFVVVVPEDYHAPTAGSTSDGSTSGRFPIVAVVLGVIAAGALLATVVVARRRRNSRKGET
jgi:hypothetical protein